MLGYTPPRSGGRAQAGGRARRRGRERVLQSDWNRFGRWRGGLAALALALCQGLAAGGAEPEAESTAPPAVDLDRLLQLPASVEVPREQIGSATKSQWRARFASARAEHEAARTGLEAAQQKLGTLAGSSEAWQMAVPGAGVAGASDAPLDYQLTQELRRQREDLARSERHLRELTIEADLAGVPAEWRE